MYIKQLIFVLTATVILFGFVGPASANLVLNGSFEDPVVDPIVGITTEIIGDTTGNWTQLAGVDPNFNFYGDGNILGLPWAAAHGDQSRHLGASNGLGGIFQDFTTTPSQQYLLTFSSSGFPGSGSVQTGYVSVGTTSDPGAYLDTSYTTPGGANFIRMGWTTQQYTFTATDSTSRLTFVSPGAPYTIDGAITIDNVQLDVLTSLPALTVDRDTGAMTLSNSMSAAQIVEYSIISENGTVDPNNWKSVSGNYDADNGGSFDPDDNWDITTSTAFELSESQAGPTGDGGSLGGSPLVLSSGGGWVQSPDELLRMELVLFGGELMSVPVTFVGNGGTPFERSDLNFDGKVDPKDWPTFRDNNLEDLSDRSPAQAYGRGDLDGDGDNDVFDFRLFKDDFEAAQGLGSFAAMIGQVPEPSSILLVSLAGVLFLGTRYRDGKVLMRCLVILPMIAVFANPASANLVLNGSFEDPVTGFLVVPTSWTLDTDLDDGELEGAYTPFDLNAFDGDRVLHPGGSGLTGGFYQDITTEVGETYDVSAWFRVFNGLANFDGRATLLAGEPGTDATTINIDPNGIPITTSQYSSTGLANHVQDATTTGTWTEAAFQFAATGTTTRLGVYSTPEFSDPAPGSLDLDLVSVNLAFSLLATVDTVTGNLTLENNGTNPIPAFDFYQIDSLGGALDKDGWFSLDEQNFQPTGTGVGETWDESGGSDAFHLAELYLAGNSTLDVGASVDLGSAFDPSVFGSRADGDLSLFLSLVGGGFVNGTVQYEASSVPGDFDFDGDVDGEDFLLWQRDPGVGLLADWENYYGFPSGSLAAASAVPEPATLAMLGSLLLCSLFRRKHGRLHNAP